ncbi:type I restriction-modification system subunit M [Salinisphaera hydrothermalis]|uniref:type I restriction-modification system subunit M n=1 Tax=Salinisphaera hydrothermalis TaxID=563188 RepID=UPI0033412C05
MITGEIKSQIDRIWEMFWSGGIANPLEVIEQMTYLLFIKRLDELQTVREKKASRLGRPIDQPIFGPDQQHLRWSVFRELGDAQALYDTVADEVFPFIKTLGEGAGRDGADATYSAHMKDARFTIPSPALLAKVVDAIDAVPMDDRDTKGDVYEYMLSKIASAGQNGQFRTPRHIIKLMVDMMAPTPADTICDPACGTAGFLVAASEYLTDHHQAEIYGSEDATRRFNHDTFYGFDFDSTMLRIGSMNMLLHGVENPAIENRDALSESHAAVAGEFSLVLANPPFAGSLDFDATAKDLQAMVKTKKTELLFLALFLRLLKPGGRAAVIVPDGVLFGSSKAHKSLRKTLIENQKLEAVIAMPSGVFKPYAGVSTAILVFTKTESGGTDNVWFYQMEADGLSLDDKRTPLTSKQGESEHSVNNLPDILARWHKRDAEYERERTEQSFLVPKAEIADNDYDLSINRYKEIVYEEVEYDPPAKILGELRALESQIQTGLDELEALLER